MAVSAQIEIDVGSGYQTPGESQNMPPAGGYVYLRIVNMAGIDPTRIVWTNFGTHNSTQAALVATEQGNPTGQIARFTVPAGMSQGFGFRLDVNGGEGVTNGASSTIAVYVLNDQGRRPFFIGETDEDNSTHYSVPRLNEISNAAGSASIGPWKVPARAATTAALPANTRTGSTLKADAFGALGAQDGIALTVGQVLLVKDEGGGASHADNGPHEIDVLGDGSTEWEMTRIPTADESGEIYDGMVVRVGEGATYADHMFVQKTNVGAGFVINTTALEFKDQGHLGALVTTTDSGAVASLGAANTVLTTDGATPGGAWALLVNANIAAGAAITETKLAAGAINTVLQTNALGNIVWAGLPAPGIVPGANDTVLVTTAGVVGWSFLVNANIAAGAAIAGSKIVPNFVAQDIITTGDLLLNSAASFIRIGLVAGSGAGSAAAAGAIRLQVDGQIIKRNNTDAADVAVISGLAAWDNIIVGGPHPVRPGVIAVDATTTISNRINGGGILTLAAASVESVVADLRFYVATVTPVIQHATDPAAGVVGDLLTIHSQDVSGTGATTGGALLIRGGDATGAADANTGGDLTLRPGDDGGFAGGVPGVLNLQDGGGTTRFQIDTFSQVNIGAGPIVSIAAGALSMRGGATISFVATIVSPMFFQADDPAAGVVGDNLTIRAQGVTDPAGGATSGNLLLRGGRGTVHANNTDGNVAFNEVPANWQSAEEVLFVSDAVTVPSATAAAGCFLYSSAGVLTTDQALAVGLVVATAGTIRLGDTDSIQFWGTGAVNVPGMSKNASDQLFVGLGSAAGAVPTNILYGSNADQVFYLNGNEAFRVKSTELKVTVPLVHFASGALSPQITQEADDTSGITGDDLVVEAQGVSTGDGNAFSGDLGLRGGRGTVGGGNTDGNVWLHEAPASWNAGQEIIFEGEAVAIPTGNPVAGVYRYVEGGAAKVRGTGGTITTYGPADQHCEKCGYDFWINHYENDDWDAYLKVCGWCGEVYKKGPDNVLALLSAQQTQLMVRHGDGERA